MIPLEREAQESHKRHREKVTERTKSLSRGQEGRWKGILGRGIAQARAERFGSLFGTVKADFSMGWW